MHEEAVAAGPAQHVVDSGEVIDIEQDERHRVRCRVPEIAQLFEHAVPAAQAGEAVPEPRAVGVRATAPRPTRDDEDAAFTWQGAHLVSAGQRPGRQRDRPLSALPGGQDLGIVQHAAEPDVERVDVGLESTQDVFLTGPQNGQSPRVEPGHPEVRDVALLADRLHQHHGLPVQVHGITQPTLKALRGAQR